MGALALFWPGLATYDGVWQYAQALAGRYDDWHPPVMARVWAALGAVSGVRGTAPMLVVQMGLYWLGLGLLAAALAQAGRRLAAGAVLAIGVWPPLLGWQAVVLKDTQMLGALIAATGIVAWWRLRGAAVPRSAWAVVCVLLGYAMLVRANAVFAVVPLAVMLIERPLRILIRAGIGVVAIVAVLALAPIVNHRVLRASASGVERTQAIYDLSGIAVRSGDARTGLSPATIAALRSNACVRPFFWDPLGDDSRCEAEIAALKHIAPGTLYAMLAAAVLRHPIDYAAHRLAHLNSTERWLVPLRLEGAAPPDASEPNTLGLVDANRVAAGFQRVARWLVELPMGWPVAWVMVAAGALLAARRFDDPATRLARALLVSALALEASFAAISIASDLRYHLWPMTASALALVLLGTRVRHVPRPMLVGLALVLVAGGVARATLPLPPQGYRAMLG